jgi:thiosulfate/3-mercaptopyruvate sulfurtransferase
MSESPLVSTAWLAEHLDDPGVQVIDCRWYLKPFDLREGDEEYAAAHIPGAVHLVWNTDLADPASGGLGMLAKPDRYAEMMGSSGVGDDTFVVVYDDQQVTVAARTWWTLRTYGHDNVAVLDGGITKWIEEGRAVTSESPTIEPKTFTPRFQPELYATTEQVVAAVEDEGVLLVDGRMTPARVQDGGYIPNSAHLPGIEFTNEDGTWVGAEESKRRLEEAGALDADHVVAYCRGGVGATGTALAYAIAGRDDVAIYDGSWSEWILDPTTPRVALDS